MNKRPILVVSLFVIILFSGNVFAEDNEMADLKLSLELSKYIKLDRENPQRSSLDSGLLMSEFFPHLDLKKGDEILNGEFGRNTEGYWFMIEVKKISNSGRTVAFFGIGFYLIKVGDNMKKGTEYEISDGLVIGDRANLLKDMGFVDIYDMGTGQGLVNGPRRLIVKEGKDGQPEATVGSDSIIGNGALQCYCCQWSPKHTTSNLLKSGLTIGKILEKRLEALEVAGETKKYSDDSRDRFESFARMSEKAGDIVHEFHYKIP